VETKSDQYFVRTGEEQQPKSHKKLLRNNLINKVCKVQQILQI